MKKIIIIFILLVSAQYTHTSTVTLRDNTQVSVELVDKTWEALRYLQRRKQFDILAFLYSESQKCLAIYKPEAAPEQKQDQQIRATLIRKTASLGLCDDQGTFNPTIAALICTSIGSIGYTKDHKPVACKLSYPVKLKSYFSKLYWSAPEPITPDIPSTSDILDSYDIFKTVELIEPT